MKNFFIKLICSFLIIMAIPVFANEQTTYDNKIIALAIKTYNKNINTYWLNDYVVVVDFSKSEYQNRFFVVNIKTNTIIYSGLVAHGINSGDVYPTSFSNVIGSKQSSVGVFITMNTYIGSAGYSLKIRGLNPGINNNVFVRHVIIHGANYVNSKHMGHSWGCFALKRSDSRYVINLIKNNSIMIVIH